jgi:hypothetical protein
LFAAFSGFEIGVWCSMVLGFVSWGRVLTDVGQTLRAGSGSSATRHFQRMVPVFVRREDHRPRSAGVARIALMEAEGCDRVEFLGELFTVVASFHSGRIVGDSKMPNKCRQATAITSSIYSGCPFAAACGPAFARCKSRWCFPIRFA